MSKSCAHEQYKGSHYMMSSNAIKAMGKGKVCWMGKIVTHCKACGEDISHAKRVLVRTADEYMEWIK